MGDDAKRVVLEHFNPKDMITRMMDIYSRVVCEK
jgi:hypothetical protein